MIYFISSKFKYMHFSYEIKQFQTKFLEDDYQILGLLGQGSTSRVFLGNNVITNQKVVIKLFKNIPQQKIYRQIRINNKINNFYNNQKYKQDESQIADKQVKDKLKSEYFPIVRLLDVIRNKGSFSFGLIFQYLPGSPLALSPFKSLESKRLLIIKQILTSLQLIHSCEIIHRDLKPSNILLTSQGAKLFDFGLAKEQAVDDLKTNRFGTKCYYSPEVIFRIKQFDQKIDVWTAAVIMVQLATFIKPIFPYKNDLQTINQVVTLCDYQQNQDKQVIRQDFLKFISKSSSRTLQNVMYQMRQSHNIMSQLDRDEFRILVNTLKRMLKINPSLRPSAKQALQLLQPVFSKLI